MTWDSRASTGPSICSSGCGWHGAWTPARPWRATSRWTRPATHHHHLVCDSCGEVSAFEDVELERAIAQLADRVAYSVDAHDVTLRGACPACSSRD